MKLDIDSNPKNFLLSVFIGCPEPEHVKIKDIIKDISDGNFQIAHLHKTCISILFSTQLASRQIQARLEGTALNDDRRLLVELGRDWRTFGLDKAASWLSRNLGAPR